MIKLFARIFLGPDKPPPYFTIVTNGRRFTWKEDGYISISRHRTIRAACRNAWQYYENFGSKQSAEKWEKVR